MGYDPARFIGEVDEEFNCTICTMVLENPMQSTCDHLFCSECIKGWLMVDKSCPFDRLSLTPDNLKPPARYFQNMLTKLDIKCDFQPKGCPAIVKLEYLKDHLNKCEFNPDLEVICDKGCNIKMSRFEYQMNNCFMHLANQASRQDEKILKLKVEANEQMQEITKLKEELSSQKQHIAKLNNEVSRLNSQQKLPESPGMKIIKLKNTSNMKISTYDSEILESGGNYGNACAQFFHPLQTENSSFKIQILNANFCDPIIIGLTAGRHSTDVAPGYEDGSIGYLSSGRIYVERNVRVGPEFRVGDIIECGIRSIKKSILNLYQSAEVYFAKNGQLVTQVFMNIPADGLFPTVFMFDANPNNVSRVKFLQ